MLAVAQVSLRRSTHRRQLTHQNCLNHDLASPSSRALGKHIVFPAAIVPGFSTTVIT